MKLRTIGCLALRMGHCDSWGACGTQIEHASSKVAAFLQITALDVELGKQEQGIADDM
jgi:hypothetical protein